jgi:hypothetical protein
MNNEYLLITNILIGLSGICVSIYKYVRYSRERASDKVRRNEKNNSMRRIQSFSPLRHTQILPVCESVETLTNETLARL